MAPDESAEPPPTALALYAAMMKDDVAPRLRRLGLKGSGGRFHLPSDTCWALLGFQRSAWNDADHVRFTVNLTCVAKAAWEAARETKGLSERPRPNVHYGLFAPSTRIGALRPDLRPDLREDTWWDVRSGVATGPVADAVMHDIETHGLPWLVGQVAEAEIAG